MSSSSCPIECLGHFSALCFQKAKEKLLSQGSSVLLFGAHRISLIYFKATETLAKFPPSCFPPTPIMNIKQSWILKLKNNIEHHTILTHSSKKCTKVDMSHGFRPSSACSTNLPGIFHFTSMCYHSVREQNVVKDNK